MSDLTNVGPQGQGPDKVILHLKLRRRKNMPWEIGLSYQTTNEANILTVNIYNRLIKTLSLMLISVVIRGGESQGT